MDWEEFEKHKPFAGDKKPSMLRRRVGHDYESRRIYLITMTVEGRLPLLGTLVGDADAPEGSSNAPRVVLSPLGEQVRDCWLSIERHYPDIKVLATMVMPDHLHGILFVQKKTDYHLGTVIKGFKIGCNKLYRQSFLSISSSHSSLPISPSSQSSFSSQSSHSLSHSSLPISSSQSSMLQHCCSKGNSKGNSEGNSEGSIKGNGKGNGKENDRSHGYLWARNYNDHILEGPGELERWFSYLRDNPRRLSIRRAHPDFFRVCFGVKHAGQVYSAIGNRFLLSYPEKLQVQCSRSLTDEQITQTVEQMLAKARRGVVLVSPAISKGEQAVMRAALDACLPLIFLTPWGFNEFSRPGHQYYEACAQGHFLILAPWPHENQRIPLTRDMCMALNVMAAAVANG